MAAYTLDQVRTLVLQRADMENTTFVSTSLELTNYVNESLRELTEVLMALLGHESFVVSADAQIAAGTRSVSITPDDDIYLKIVRVETVIDSNQVPLKRRNLYDEILSTETQTWNVDMDLSYTLGGTQNGSLGLSVDPIPAATTTVTVYFVPFYPRITTATEPIQPRLNQWIEYAVIDSAIKCKEKEESDTSALERAKANYLARMEKFTATVDKNSMTIADVRNDDDNGDYVTWWY